MASSSTSTANSVPKTALLGFLDFLLDYVKQVKCSEVDCVPKIREHLIFLRSFTGKLMELKQEGLESLWNVAVVGAYKMGLIIDQMVLADIPDSLSASFLSDMEDMITMIKKVSVHEAAGDAVGFETENAESLEILNLVKEVQEKLRVQGLNQEDTFLMIA